MVECADWALLCQVYVDGSMRHVCRLPRPCPCVALTRFFFFLSGFPEMCWPLLTLLLKIRRGVVQKIALSRVLPPSPIPYSPPDHRLTAGPSACCVLLHMAIRDYWEGHACCCSCSYFFVLEVWAGPFSIAALLLVSVW